MRYWEKPVCGIYKITNKNSKKAYIGQSIDIGKRWKSHMNFCQAKHKWQVIKHALFNHGLNSFTFEVLEECHKEILDDRERFWIKYFGTQSPDGYNLTEGGGGGCSKETAAKIVKIKKQRGTNKISDEQKAKLSAIGKGRKQSEEHKAKITASKIGKQKIMKEKTCPYCGKTGRQNMVRYHFDNCKVKLNQEDETWGNI